MEGLLVIHTEIEYVSQKKYGRRCANETKTLFDKIAAEIGRYIKREDRVYYLAEESESQDSRLIYTPIKSYFPNMTFIPNEAYRQQCLVAKELILSDKPKRVALAGVAYDACVMNMYTLLLGKENPDTGFTKLQYGEIAKAVLGWSKDEFEKIFSHKVNAQIREDLTK